MENDTNNEVYSKVVRAGKRTYFFDVKSTKGNDLYLILTESKKTTNADGSESFQKHKLFLYKEDFEKFRDGLEDVLAKIDALKNTENTEKEDLVQEDSYSTSISFEDL
jgi:hypothetical protein